MTQPGIAVFGGSFNPPHVGHVMLMSAALSLLPISRLWVVPCGCHPLTKQLVGFEHRLRMVHLATLPFGDRVVVSDIERSLTQPSYTLHTLQALRAQLPLREKIFLLLGGDTWREREHWYCFDLVEKMCEIVVFNRGDQRVTDHLPLGDIPEISSTTVRDLLRRGLPVSTLLPIPVAAYCRGHNLYSAGGPQ